PSRLRFGLENGVVMWAEGLAEAEGFNLLAEEDRIGLHVDRGSILQDTRQIFDPEHSELYGEVTNLDVVYSSGEDGSTLDVMTGDSFLRFEELQVTVDLANQHPLSSLGDQVHFQTRANAEGYLDRVFLDIPEGGRIEVLQEDMHAVLLEQSSSLERNPDGSISLDGLGFNIDLHTRDMDTSITSDVFRATFDPTRGLVFDDIRNARIVIDTADGDELDMDFLIRNMRDVAYQQFSIDGGIIGEALMLTPTSDGSYVDASLRFEYQGIPFRIDAKGAGGIEALAGVKLNEFHAYVIDPKRQGEVAFESGPFRAEGHGGVSFVGRVVPYDPMRALKGIQRMASSDGGTLCGVFRFEPVGVV
ncbi:MAG: hypothetical protein AAF658_21585, partial [Myxococcota bacterium]